MEGTSSDYLQERFEVECELLERLHHEHVPRVYTHFRLGESAYLVMDYIPGPTIEDWIEGLRGAPAPVETVLRYALQVCEVLEYLHGQPKPLIHRDVKPQNVIIAPTGDVTLVDFGLARSLDLENTKTQVGTVGYAPMEQVRGQPEPCSDIYSLGATMYFMLAGHHPKPFQIPPLGEERPDVPEKVAAIVAMATQQNPARRYLTATRMKQALVEALRDVQGLGAPERDIFPEIQSHPEGVPWYFSPLPLMGAMVVLLVIVIAGFGGCESVLLTALPLRSRHASPSPSARATLAATPTSAPEVPLEVSFQAPAAELTDTLHTLLGPQNGSGAGFTGVSGMDATGALVVDGSAPAGARLTLSGASASLPRTVSFRLLPHGDDVRLVVRTGPVRAVFHFEAARQTWSVMLAGLNRALVQQATQDTWSSRYALYVTAHGAELRQEAGGVALAVGEHPDAADPIDFVVDPASGPARAQLQDVEVTAAAPPF